MRLGALLPLIVLTIMTAPGCSYMNNFYQSALIRAQTQQELAAIRQDTREELSKQRQEAAQREALQRQQEAQAARD